MDAYLIGYAIDGPRGARNALLHVLADEVYHTEASKAWLKLLPKDTKKW